MRYHPENTVAGKTKAAVAGVIPRVLSIVGGVPQGLLNTYNYARDFTDIPDEEAGMLTLPGHMPRIPENIINALPSDESLINRLKDTPFEDILPKGSLEPHPFIDRPLAFAATAPLFGMNPFAGGVKGYLGKAAGMYPTGLAGETSRETAEALKLSPGWQTAAEVGGGLIGGLAAAKGGRLIKSVAGKAKPAIESLAEKLINKKMPLYKEAGRIASQEEVQATQLAREEAKIRLRESKIAAKQEADTRKALDKYNESHIAEQSKSDVQKLNARKQVRKDLERFYEDNNKQMSKQDYEALQQKIANGERIDLPREWDAKLSGFNQDILEHRNMLEGVRTSEEAMIDTAGSQPSVLREHARDLYSQFEESTTDKMTTAYKPLEPILQELEEDISYGIDNITSKKNLKNIMDGIRAKFKNGRVKVRDLAAFKKDINESLRRWAKENGSLERFEKSAPKINKYIDSTLNLAKEEHPTIKLDKLRKADKITAEVSTAERVNRELKELAESNLPFNKTRYVFKWLKDKPNLSYFFKSPNVRKYYFNAAEAWGKRNSKEAIRNLMALDKTLEHEYSKKSNISTVGTMPSNIAGNYVFKR
jgi:hypothetical protein